MTQVITDQVADQIQVLLGVDSFIITIVKDEKGASANYARNCSGDQVYLVGQRLVALGEKVITGQQKHYQTKNPLQK